MSDTAERLISAFESNAFRFGRGVKRIAADRGVTVSTVDNPGDVSGADYDAHVHEIHLSADFLAKANPTPVGISTYVDGQLKRALDVVAEAVIDRAANSELDLTHIIQSRVERSGDVYVDIVTVFPVDQVFPADTDEVADADVVGGDLVEQAPYTEITADDLNGAFTRVDIAQPIEGDTGDTADLVLADETDHFALDDADTDEDAAEDGQDEVTDEDE